MKTFTAFVLISINLNSLLSQDLPNSIKEIPLPPSFSENSDVYYLGSTLFRFALKNNFIDKKKIGERFSNFSLEILRINEYTSPETFEVQSSNYTEFYNRILNPGLIPHNGAINIENTDEPEICRLNPGESSRVYRHSIGEIEWYYYENKDVIKRFILNHKNYPPRLQISEEIYIRDTSNVKLPDFGGIHFPIVPQSIFLPDESSLTYQYVKSENSITISGKVKFQSLTNFDETVKFFENKLNSKAEKFFSGQGVYFKKLLANNYEPTTLSIEIEPKSYAPNGVSDTRVLVIYDYSKPKCNHKIIINDKIIFH